MSYKKGDRVLCLVTGRIYEVFSEFGDYIFIKSGNEFTTLWKDSIVPATPLVEELT